MKKKTNKICSDCVHYHACSSWNVGSLYNTNAEHCYNFETVDDIYRIYGIVDLMKRNINNDKQTTENERNNS